MNTTKLDYGIDAPGVIRNLILIGFALLGSVVVPARADTRAC